MDAPRSSKENKLFSPSLSGTKPKVLPAPCQFEVGGGIPWGLVAQRSVACALALAPRWTSSWRATCRSWTTSQWTLGQGAEAEWGPARCPGAAGRVPVLVAFLGVGVWGAMAGRPFF